MKMRWLLIPLLIISQVCMAASPQRVKGSFRKKTGKYVAPHYRTKANSTKMDNYSTKGNVNPYTGKKGSVNPGRVRRKKK